MAQPLRILLILTLTTAAACGGTPTDTPTPTAAGGGWQRPGEDLPAALMSVAGTSAADVWTVGADAGDGPLILHFDGDSWTRIQGASPGDLWWVWLPDASTVWMAGAGGRVLRYDREDGTFTETSLDHRLTFFGIWGASEDEVWAVGGNPDVSGDGATVWRWGEATWSEQQLPAEAASQVAMYKVWGSAADDVWVVGDGGVAIHWDGEAWSAVDTGQSRTLFTVAGSGRQDVYAVGGYASGAALRWDGAAWTDEAPPAAPQLNGVAARAGVDPVAVGIQGAVYWRSGGAWTPDDRGPVTSLDLHGAWLDEAGDLWAVGGHLSAYPLDRGLIVYGGDREIPEL